jgi:hypothetical protein
MCYALQDAWREYGLGGANSVQMSAQSSQPSIRPRTPFFMNLQRNSAGLMSRDLQRNKDTAVCRCR